MFLGTGNLIKIRSFRARIVKLLILNLTGGSKYKIYNMTTLYLHPPSKFKIYNMTGSKLGSDFN